MIPNTRRVGFIGLGAMGLPMAENLARAGNVVRGYDIRDAAGKALAAAGGIAALSAADALKDADFAILMVVNAAQAEEVLFSGDALLSLAPGATVILMATCPPGTVASLAARVEAAGFVFVDAPVSGGVVGAKAGSLTIMAAASDAAFTNSETILRTLGSKLFHVGTQAGQGATAKAVNQLLCGVHIAVAAEAMSLADKLGVDTATMLEIVSGSAASSWMLKDRGARMLEEEPDVASAIDIFVKDLGIVLEAGRDAKAALPMAALAHQLFLSVSGRGMGTSDDSQVIRAYRSLQGKTV